MFEPRNQCAIAQFMVKKFTAVNKQIPLFGSGQKCFIGMDILLYVWTWNKSDSEFIHLSVKVTNHTDE